MVATSTEANIWWWQTGAECHLGPVLGPTTVTNCPELSAMRAGVVLRWKNIDRSTHLFGIVRRCTQWGAHLPTSSRAAAPRAHTHSTPTRHHARGGAPLTAATSRRPRRRRSIPFGHLGQHRPPPSFFSGNTSQVIKYFHYQCFIIHNSKKSKFPILADSSTT